MGVGSNRPLRVGDKLKALCNLYYYAGWNVGVTNESNEIINKGDIVTLKNIDDEHLTFTYGILRLDGRISWLNIEEIKKYFRQL
jgi:hypothetical protein